MTPTPVVSIIMPAYNASRYMRESLRSAAGQTFGDVEIIVIDDGSEDDTAEHVRALAHRDPRVRLITQPNAGVAAARNAGIAAARGQYVAPFDADDLWMPRKLEQQLARFEQAGDEVGLVYSWWRRVREDGHAIYSSDPVRKEGRVLEALIRGNFLGTASVPLIRREALERVGGYDVGARAAGGQGCEDWDLAIRIAEHYSFAVVPDYLVEYRDTPGSMSYDFEAMSRAFDRVLDRLQERQQDLPPRLLRRSRSAFQITLAKKGFGCGDRRAGWRHSRRALAADPLGVMAQAVSGLFGESGRRLRQEKLPGEEPQPQTAAPPVPLRTS